MWLWLSKPMGSHFGIGAPPILEPILVGIWMFLTHGHVARNSPSRAGHCTCSPSNELKTLVAHVGPNSSQGNMGVATSKHNPSRAFPPTSNLRHPQGCETRSGIQCNTWLRPTQPRPKQGLQPKLCQSQGACNLHRFLFSMLRRHTA